MSYDKHTWETNEAITKEKLNNIENGIASIETQVINKGTDISTLNTKVENYNSAIWGGLGFQAVDLSTQSTTIAGRLQSLWTAINNSSADTLRAELDAVIAQVDEARRVPGSNNPSQWPNLVDVLSGMKQTTAQVSDVADGAATSATSANNKLDSLIESLKGTYLTPKAHIDAIDSDIDSVEDDIQDIKDYLDKPTTSTAAANTLLQEIVDAHRTTSDTLDNRFDALDTQMGSILGNGNDTLQTQLTNVKTEVEAARVSSANGNTTYTTLDDRLEADETSINALQTEVGAAHRSGVQNDTLDNRFDDVEADISSIETAIDHVQGENDEVPNGLKQRMTAAESAITTINDTTIPDLDTRLDAIDGETTPTRTLPNVIGEIDTAHREHSGHFEEDEETHERVEIDDTLDLRFDDIESNLSTINSDLNTAETGLKAKVNTLETNVGSISDSIGTGFDSTNTIAAAIASKADSSALNAKADASTVNAISTTIVLSKTEVNFDANNVPTTLVSGTIADKDDYLIQSPADDKYYYWKHINSAWHLMGGAGNGEGGGGTGNSNAEDYETFSAFNSANPESNKDYYVLQEDGVRHHYRYLHSLDENDQDVWTRIEIGQVLDTSKIKRYNIATETSTVDGTDVTYLNLYQYDYDEVSNAVDTERQPFTQIILPQGGGGGGISGNINKLVRIGDQTIQKITGSTVLLRIFYSSYDSSGTESSSGDYVLKAGNTTIATGVFNSGASDADLTQGWQENTLGYYEFDVTDYCSIGNTNFILTVTVNGTSLGKSWTVNIVDLHLETTAPDVLLINYENTYDFPYTAFGALNKTLYVVIDDDTEHQLTANLPSTTSGRTTSITIPAQSHGAHKIEMYLKATVGGVLQQTPSIIREYIWYNPSSSTTILASPMNGETITAQQYSTIEIPYQVYQKDATTITLEYYVDDSVTPFDTITLEDANTGILSYLASTQGSHSITIKVAGVNNVSIDVDLEITELNIDVSPISGAIIDFDPTMLTNSSNNRLPTWTYNGTTYSLTASDNFNWSDDASGGGYKTESDGKCFVVKAGTYVDLDYPMFAGNGSNNILTNGAEMKIIFKTEAVRNIDAVWFRNTGTLTEKTVGIQLGAHFGWLKTDKATDTITTSAGTEYDAWVSGTNYTLDSIVLYKDGIYKCIKLLVDHTDVIPGTSAAESYWGILEGDNIPSDVSGIAAWVTGTKYTKDTIVSYNNAYYKCKKDVINELITDPKTASSNWLSMGKIDTEVLATNSYLYFPYSEEDKIELDINVNQYNANADTNFIMSYEDGVPSKAYAYEYGTAGDGLYHSNTIRIGSNDCDVYIYRLRIYNKSLKTSDILQNFIADGNGINEKVSRYNRNCIYWDSTQEKFFTSPSATAVLDPIKLAERMPDVKILMLDTPTFTTGKKNFVQYSNLRCLQADGGTVYPSRGDADNWFFMNGFHSGQGTTSDNYGQSSRNVDFLFEVDGVNYPTKKKNMGGYVPSNEYVSQVLVGKTASTWNGTTWEAAREPNAIEICDDWKGDKCKVALTESSVPNNYFNLKVNVASSENVNNALFQKRYDDFLTYHSPAQTKQMAKHRTNYTALGMNPNKIKVKNDMEFVPAVLFLRENDTTVDGNGNYTKHNEFNDTNWHFYALGNIGDSKKTDYTRAYDPDDMNEFTCENSDNNTNNGQFQSGVFTYQDHRAIETPYAAYDEEEEYESGAIVVDDGVIKVYDGTNWSNATITDWTDQDTPYFAPFTAPNPMEYLYPITSSEWNIKIGNDYVNYKHNTLVNEEFDGDHSFEFRYGCRGDYRDGDPINVSPDQDNDAQFALNHDVMLAFYEWLITATEEQYIAEAPQWFVKSAMEFFYAFTHYYTMMDNRAKNTFWHFAKTGNYIEVSRPVKELLHVYEESSDNGTTWTAATGTTIDPNKKYRTQYAFDLWTYDCDTAAGIDNNGALVFPYGKEDTDYRTEGDPLSGYAFNGAGSIFWRRLKTTFASEIVDIMSSTDVNCFNSQDLIDQFDKFQNCFPEEIWRLDIERKYIRTFTGESVDNSITTGKQNPRFLTSMMQGRKKYQRRQWIRDQGVYFNSKYRLADITDNSNTIEFNCTTPANIENIAVTPSYYLQLTPYQDMYLNVQVGNGNYKDSYMTVDGSKSLRAKAGQTYTFNLSGNYQETRIYINGANHLSAIGNLAAMYPYSFDLRALAHIKTLDIGTDESGYINTKFTELKLPTYMPLLESLNIKNCHSVAGTIGLSTANNIRSVEATGTAITGVSLPDYTNLETLHIPSTVTALNLYGARMLTDFKVYNNAGTVDYSSLYKLHIYDSDYSATVDWIGIAQSILSKQSLETELSLLRLSSASIVNISTLEPFSEFKTTLENAGGILELTGTINITGNWSTIERDTYGGQPTSVWPALNFNLIGEEQYKQKVTYKYNNKEYVIYVIRNTTIPDPYAEGWIELPQKPSDAIYSYTFGLVDSVQGLYQPYSGWKYLNSSEPLSSAPIVGTSDITVEAYFRTVKRLYTIRWFLDSNKTQKVGEISSIPYGGGENVVSPSVQNIHEGNYNSNTVVYGQYETCEIFVNDNGAVNYKIFAGWNKSPINIQPDGSSPYYDIFAIWDADASATVSSIFNTVEANHLTAKQLLVLSAMSEEMKATEPFKTLVSTYAPSYHTTVNLGYDSNATGAQVLISDNSNTAKYLNGLTSASYSTNIQPFTNGEFTFVIDYTFADETIAENKYSVLASCYHSQDNVKHGFGIFKTSGGVQVGFGDMYGNGTTQTSNRRTVSSSSNANMRNILVLRYKRATSAADTYDKLYIYSSTGNSLSLPSTSVNVQTINRTANPNFTSNSYLNFGQLFDSTNQSIQSGDGILNSIIRAKAWIHWAKYWNYDIGADECYKLASWPHELLTLGIAYSYKDGNSINTSRTLNTPTPSIYLATLNNLSHGFYTQSSISSSDFNSIDNSYGWRDSDMRKLYNNRLFAALPLDLQAIIMKPELSNKNVTYSPGDDYGYGATYNLDSISTTTRDYVYAYSAANVIDSSTYADEDILMNPFSWKIPNNIKVYNYSSGSWEEAQNPNSNYLNIRFPYKAINWSLTKPLRIYVVSQLSQFDDTAAEAIGSTTIRSGDILIAQNKAYIYVSNYEIQKYGLFTESDNAKLVGIPDEQATQIESNNAGNGGWILSDSYWTRSLVCSTSKAIFADVSVVGEPNISTTPSGNSTIANRLNFIIAI